MSGKNKIQKSQKKSYPYILVHGMLGFGEGEKVNDILPYWGFTSGSLLKMLEQEGKTACAPSISSLGSAWDRACELYAQLVGGTVDYGKVHSEKYGHARFGRTYDKPILPDWGKPDAEGRLNKIHIIGHSFGGATVRMFSQLMAHGAPEEVAGTASDDLSPLFAGGKGDWLQSVTTVAGPHNGTTVITAIGILLPILKVITFFGFAGFMGNTIANQYYDMSLDQWGVTSDPREKPNFGNFFRFGKIMKVFTTKDNLYYDLSLAGARDLNKFFEINEDAYHFSISTSNSIETRNGNHRMKNWTTFPPFIMTGNMVGSHRYDKSVKEELGDEWLESDGCSNTVSALHPDDEPFMSFYDANGKYKRGIWTVMPVYQGDHMDVVGFSVPNMLAPYKFKNYWKKFFQLLDDLD